VTDISVDISDDPVSVSVSNVPGPSGASSFFKGVAAAWPPTATPTAGWIYTLPDPVPAGTPAGYLPGYGAQWDGLAWVNIGPVRGPAGPAGPQGAAGPAGSPGAAGPQGPAGNTGPAGIAGPQGPAGAAGSNGTNGTSATIAVGTVTTGSPGSAASVTNSGSSLAAVFDITIPRGDVGPAGPAGATGASGAPGAAGPAGAAASISVGSVSTGAAGSSATVVNSGTSAAAILDFVIPQGAAGAAGPAGSSGVISVTAPIVNSGSSSSAALSLAIGSGLSVVGGALVATGLTSVSWGDVTGKPTTFTPSAHASTHQTGGADAVASVVVTPSSLTADQNDWAIGTGDIFRVAGAAARNITGIAAGTSGMAVLLVNVGTFALTLKHQNASSSAANRITVPWAGDCVLAANGGAVVLVYDSTSSTWRVV
jgi:hypothetical protein